MVEEEEELTERQKEIARLRAAEVFMRKENGDAVCGTCGYNYQMAKGDDTLPPLPGHFSTTTSDRLLTPLLLQGDLGAAMQSLPAPCARRQPELCTAGV
jgi:rubredoxin